MGSSAQIQAGFPHAVAAHSGSDRAQSGGPLHPSYSVTHPNSLCPLKRERESSVASRAIEMDLLNKCEVQRSDGSVVVAVRARI